MGFFKKDSRLSLKDNESVSSIDINDVNSRLQFQRFVIQELNRYINEFAFGCEEVEIDNFKRNVNELAERLISDEKTRRLEHVFDRYKKILCKFISDCKTYFREKENEYKNIIKLLTEGITAINIDSKAFNVMLMEQGARLEKINALTDIKEIKEHLKEEVKNLRCTVKNKVEKDSKSLEMLAEKVTVLKKDLEKAEAASMTDGLTGVFNRLAFDIHINALMENVSLKWTSFALMMIDIDNFKNINDTYGHIVGDRVIIAAVQACKKFLRKNDFIARYGGEEFVMVFEGMSLKIAQKKADEICKKISLTDFLIDKEKSNESLSFTISVGLSTYKEGDSAHTIVDRADKALYKAKSLGKNRAINERDI